MGSSRIGTYIDNGFVSVQMLPKRLFKLLVECFCLENAWKNEAAATWFGDETCTPVHATGFRSDGEHLPQLGGDSQSRRSVPLSCEYKGKDRESSPRAMVIPTTAFHCVCECSRGFRHGEEGGAISG